MTVRCGVALTVAVVFHGMAAQPAQAQCSYSVSPTTISVPSTGSAGSVTVITGSSCAWTATSTVGWITITSNASATGLASSNYTIAANPAGTTRVGTMIVAGRTVTVTQGAGSCNYNVSPLSATVPSTGTNSSISVITGSSCAWTATSAVGWITITRGASSVGLASVDYTVAPTTVERTGTMTVAGRTVTIIQEGRPRPAAPANFRIVSGS
jgi:hypothetical protein